MSERILNEFLDVLPISIEEKRAIGLLLRYENPVTAELIRTDYEKTSGIRIGNRIYHILGILERRKLVIKSKEQNRKLFIIDKTKLMALIKDVLGKEKEKIQEKIEKFEFARKMPSITTHVGVKSVAELFLKIIEKLKEGCEWHVINNTLAFPVWSEEEIDKKMFIREDRKLMNTINRNRINGRLKEYWIIDREKYEDFLKSLTKKFGTYYVRSILRSLIKFIELKKINVIFGKDLGFRFFVIPNYCAVTAWASSPKQISLDRAIAFWYHDDIKGLEEHFWDEWKRILEKRNEDEAKKEVKEWAVDLLERI